MIKKIALIALLSIICCACKDTAEDRLIGKWRSVKIEESTRDAFFEQCRHILDTMGNGHTDAENIEIYGVTNIDSLRGEMQIQYDSAVAGAKVIETQSSLHFKSDKSVIVGFPGMNETGTWSIDANGNLVIDETNKFGESNQTVTSFTLNGNDELRLTFTRNTGNELTKDSSVVTFRREKN